MSLEYARLRLDNASQRTNRFIDDHIVEWTEEEIAEPIRNNMRSVGLSQRVIEAVYVEKTDFMKAEVVFNLQDGDVDLSDLLELGSRPHEILPKGKDAGGANTLRWIGEAGDVHFAKRVFHPGFQGYHFMEKGVRENEYELQKRIEREVETYLDRERLN